MQNSTVTPAIYISYAWGSESEAIAKAIEEEFQKRGQSLHRDENVLGYKGRIKAFMEQIGRANYVILVISNKYLHSVNCMFELVQIFKNRNFYERIFPVVLDEVNITDPSERVKLMKYWEYETESLSNEIKQLKDLSNIQGLTEDLNLNAEIRDNIARLTSILKDTNTLSVNKLLASNFQQLFDAVQKKIKIDSENESTIIAKQETTNHDEQNSQNIFVRIKAKIFGTTAFFEVANKNKRRVISFGITAIVGVCIVFLALPHLSQDTSFENVSGVESPTVVKDSVISSGVQDSMISAPPRTTTKEKEEVPISNVKYIVELVVPSRMANADVFVDGKRAEIVERGLISITVRLRKKNSSHHFEVKDGDESCMTDKLIEKDQLKLTLCD